MRITAKEFKNLPNKSITLIGMSGAGKSHISSQLEQWGWSNYSCDYEIGSKYLVDRLELGREFTANDIGALSDYIGKIGSPDKGGFLLEKFSQRQKDYYDAEVAALGAMDVPDNGDFVHDSTGSLCEIEDSKLIDEVGQKTLFVYLKTGEREDREVLQRAQDNPKPLFFPPEFLNDNLKGFLSEFNLASIGDVEPDDFARWVFPKLFEARKPKYERLADAYGVTIASSEFRSLSSSDEFLDIIESHLD